MASSEDASAPRLNVWTPKEFRDLVKAWELALARPQATTDRPESLHDTVYDQFVALCGGHSRRNKAALTSKRSALKFSYLHVRDFNRSQSRHKAKLFFDLSEKERRSILKQFKKTNSNVLDISREMYKALERIIRQGGGDDDAAVLPGTRPKEEEDRSARTETRTKRTSSVNWTVQQTAPGDKMVDKPAAGSRCSTTPASSSTTCTARSSSLNADTSTSIWSVDEMRQLVKAWGIAVQLVCANSTGQSMSIIQELGRQFELLQEGKSGCNLQGLATRRRALKLSYTRISAFDKIQEMNGDVAFAKLPLPTRQTLIKSWKNANLLDLPADIYSELTKVIPLDTRAIALEDMRRAKAGEPVSVGGGRSGRKQGKPLKQPRIVRSAQDSNGEESGRVAAVQPPLVAVDSEEEKAGVVRMVVRSRLSLDDEEKDADAIARNARPTEKNTLSVRVEDDARQASAGGDRNVTSTARLGIDEMVRSTTEDNVSSGPRSNATLTSCSPRKLSSVSVVPPAEGDCENADKTTRSDGESCGDTPGHAELSRDQLMMDKVVSAGSTPGIEKIELSAMDPYRQATVSEPLTTKLNQCAVAVDGVALDNCESTPQNERPSVATTPADGKADAQKLAKKKRKLRVDGPKGLLWENSELQILIHAWERASILMCNSDPAERLSLNKEMYREFVQMQGGSSVRNSTALAARRSSLKFSYAHIESFDKAQEAKGEPCYHEIPEDKRMALLRSWKNRNSVDLTKEMYDGLGRILAMDEQLARVRSLRPPPLLKPKKKADSPEEAKHSVLGPDASHLSKAAKWTTEESSDLIKACADVMNVPSDQEQSPTKRESLIYDAFVTRRQNAGDTEIPFRRDLRSMAQQWRYILASYSYIRACNDNCSEGESPSWFDMSPVQKRAYQQCTNVPAKFVDLDAEMFALVTKTSFMGEAAISPPSPVVKGVTEGISLRPRSMRKRTEAFWSSDSDSSVNSLPRAKRTSKKAPVVSAGKKVTNWPVEEIWELIRAWDEVSRVMGNCRLSLTLDETFALFTKAQDGPPIHGRTHSSVRNKLIALKSSYSKITAYISERGDSSAWFDMPRAERMIEIRSWKKKTIIDLGRDMYDALKQIVLIGGNGVRGKRTIRKLDRPPTSPPASFGSKDPIEQDRKDHAWQKPEKSVVANWSKEELLMLGEACGELLEGRRSRRYVFEEEKDRFFRRYEELGGTNSPTAAVGLARFVLDSYEFIYFYDQKAAERDSLFWFELDVADREQIVARMGKTYRSFNGLSTVDKDIFDVIDGIDAELRVKLGETKKKTYKPPNDASSRYVDIEAVVDQCEFQLRNGAAPTNPKAREASAESEASSSDEKADVSSSDSSSAEESAGSDSSAPVGVRSRRVTHSEEKVIRVPKHHVVRPGSTAAPSRATPPCKRKREAVAGASSTLYITEIIQKQNRKLEQAVKRFRKESADNRKKHHAFLVQKIQDSFPVDTGHGSYLERVAERQGQTLVVIFQKLQQHRDAEKAKDEELMRELFGQSGPS